MNVGENGEFQAMEKNLAVLCRRNPAGRKNVAKQVSCVRTTVFAPTSEAWTDRRREPYSKVSRFLLIYVWACSRTAEGDSVPRWRAAEPLILALRDAE
jgi:hypothetical protein